MNHESCRKFSFIIRDTHGIPYVPVGTNDKDCARSESTRHERLVQDVSMFVPTVLSLCGGKEKKLSFLFYFIIIHIHQHIHPINQHILSQSVAQFSHSLDLDSLLRHSVPQSVARSLRSLDSNASKRKKSLGESMELVQGDLLNMPPDILLHHCDQHHL